MKRTIVGVVALLTLFCLCSPVLAFYGDYDSDEYPDGNNTDLYNETEDNSELPEGWELIVYGPDYVDITGYTDPIYPVIQPSDVDQAGYPTSEEIGEGIPASDEYQENPEELNNGYSEFTDGNPESAGDPGEETNKVDVLSGVKPVLPTDSSKDVTDDFIGDDTDDVNHDEEAEAIVPDDEVDPSLPEFVDSDEELSTDATVPENTAATYFNPGGLVTGEVYSSPAVGGAASQRQLSHQLLEEADALREYNRQMVQNVNHGVVSTTVPGRTVGARDVVSFIALGFVIVCVVVLWIVSYFRNRNDPLRKWLR